MNKTFVHIKYFYIRIDISLSLYRHKGSDTYHKINNVLVFLLFYNFAFKELHYCMVCLSDNWRN